MTNPLIAYETFWFSLLWWQKIMFCGGLCCIILSVMLMWEWVKERKD